jgi:phage-related protein
MSFLYTVSSPTAPSSPGSLLRFPYVPDYASPLEETPRIRKAQFGDGYEQRTADGLNTILQKWSVKFNVRPRADADEILAFFRALGGTTPFEFVVPYSDWSVVAEQFGTGDGTRTQFQLQRQVLDVTGAEAYPGAFSACSDFDTGPSVYVAGSLKTAGVDYTLSDAGVVAFTVAPANGAALTFTATGQDVKTMVCEGPWSASPTDFNSFDISTTFQEVLG